MKLEQKQMMMIGGAVLVVVALLLYFLMTDPTIKLYGAILAGVIGVVLLVLGFMKK